MGREIKIFNEDRVGTSKRQKKNQRKGTLLRTEYKVIKNVPCNPISSSKLCEKDISIIMLLSSELKFGNVKKIGQDSKTRKSKARIQTQVYLTPKIHVLSATSCCFPR